MLTTLFYVLLAIMITAIVMFILMSFVFVDFVLDLFNINNRDKYYV